MIVVIEHVRVGKEARGPAAFGASEPTAATTPPPPPPPPHHSCEPAMF